MKKRFYIRTFGCQMNKNDADVIATVLSSRGYEITSDQDNADIYLVNTCSVRAHAENRALGFISTLRDWRSRKERVLGIVGCMATRMGASITSRFRHVDLVLGPDSYNDIGGFIEEIFKRKTKIIETSLTDTTYCGIYHKPRSIADYVSIMRGCDNFCSYCVVPYVRGRARSRPVEDVVSEVSHLVAQGVKDITLLGQNVNEYSYKNFGFAELLRKINQETDVFRLRFLTSHPKDLTASIVEVVREQPNVCEWFHLPLQSGSNRILELMNRRYTKEDYLNLIARIRDAIPHASITTDIITGFPTETDLEFKETLSLLEQIRFDDMYTYRYSLREGTAAAQLPALPEKTIKNRLKTLIDFQSRITAAKTREMVGKKFEVLFESSARESSSRGKNRGNKDIVVETKIVPGEVKNVLITEIKGITPVGTIINS